MSKYEVISGPYFPVFGLNKEISVILINHKISQKKSQSFELNQWKNPDIVLDWFKQIKNKHLYKFATFDIKEFYPSIKECLLKNAINFAEQHTEIFEKDKTIIFHARKSTFQWLARLDKKERRVI